MTRAYLLLDSNQIPDLYPRLYELAQLTTPHSLYLTTQYAALAQSGPVLAAVEPNSALANFFAEEWQEKAGVWLESEADEAVLVAHLRSLIHVELEGEVTAFFRYYDPRIARLWLANLPAAERDRLMGPVRLIRLPNEDGSSLTLRQENPDQPLASYTHAPWLRLSPELLEQLCKSKRAQFEQRLIAHCQYYFPACLQGLDATAQLQWAQACQRNAARQGYSAEDEVMSWVGLYAFLGEAFPDGPNQDGFRQLLVERDVSPQQRLDHLLDELTRQFISGVVAA